MELTEWRVLIRLARGQHVQQQHENEAERQEQQREVEKLTFRIIANYNKGSTPFSWTATADSILEKLQRLCSHISGT